MPVAVNPVELGVVSVGFAGVTAIETSVGTGVVQVSVVLPDLLWKDAVITDVAPPPATHFATFRVMVAVAGVPLVHVALPVMLAVVPSL